MTERVIDSTYGITLRDDVTVQLVKSSAHDSDVIWSARVSTEGDRSLASVDADPERSEGLIRYLMKNRHSSPLEHSVFTFYVEAPIFVFRELERHRIASYNEESGRYKELKPVFYVPPRGRALVQIGKTGNYEFTAGSDEQYAKLLVRKERTVTQAYKDYQESLEDGIAKEVARMDLPLSLYSSLYMTVNARSLMNVLSLRTNRPDAAYPSKPQREIEMVAEKMEVFFAEKMPIVHKYFEQFGRVSP
jgi:thymidylate synthase (FAD)